MTDSTSAEARQRALRRVHGLTTSVAHSSITPKARDRALRRVRRLTTSVAVLGAGAVGALGFVAAATNPGKATPARQPAAASSGVEVSPADQAPSTGTGQSDQQPAPATTTQPDGSSSSGGSSSGDDASQLQAPADSVNSARASGRVHAVTGGS
ncbi:MAG: hypothetical protein ABR532_04535 [Candidatus Dormibacteria bacterium]